MKHVQAKRDLERAQDLYTKSVEEGDAFAAKKASELVRRHQDNVSAAIAEGAKVCPFCKKPPHGMEQPHVVNNRFIGLEYEVGCLDCKPFKHTDGTIRKVAVRGGLLPSHTVEAWNAGPDYWSIVRT